METKKDNRTIATILVLTLLVVGFSTSCMNRSNGETQQAKVKGRESSAAFQPTKQSEDKRCGFLNYTGQPRDEHDSPDRHCFLLQERLIKGALDGDLTEIREALKDGANVEGTSYNRYPALHSATMQGHADAVGLLLDNGAQVNRVADFERTPLNIAAYSGHLNIIKVLLERGADPCYKSSAGTARDIAQKQNHQEITQLLKDAESTKCK
jgi:hypothetical protein